MNVATLVLLAACGAAIIGSARLARHPGFESPPLGAFSLGDLGVLTVMIVTLPLLHAALPQVGSLVLVTAGAGLLVYMVIRALAGRRRALAAAVALIVLDYLAFSVVTPLGRPYLAVNDVIVVIMVVAIAVSWVRSGMRPWHLALLASILIGFDYLATVATPVMADFVTALGQRPLTPSVMWSGEDGTLHGFGLGDLLLASAYPALAAKTYGGTRAVVAAGIAMTTMTALVLGLSAWPALVSVLPSPHGYIPLMLVIGPTILAQHAHAQWRRTPERPHARGRLAVGGS